VGAEIGTDLTPSAAVFLRLNAFRNRIDGAVGNVTLSVTPQLITRQRRNFGSSRSRGAEIDFEKTLGARWTINAGWLITDARLSTGNRPPQVPRHQATLQARFMSLGAQLRWSAMQFDDDLNQLALRGYFVADVFASKAIGSHVDAIVAVENLFDRGVETAATPVITLGQPRAARIGLRFHQ